jgi:transcriptional regulator with XRE-family HTH domain
MISGSMKNNHSSYWCQLIIQLREEKRWTQEQLAEMLQTDQATISRWECGTAEPRSLPVRETLERLAKESKLGSLGETIRLVQSSPFQMILVDRDDIVVAASASSGFQEGRACIEQTPYDERACFIEFQEKLRQSGFWQMQMPRIDYEFAGPDQVRRAIVTRVTCWGEVYALVQKFW